ncbi:MAG: PilZ domain-containing protein [Lachnospiraceae bacterium]|nr:PilZ domain-containing protein [Lachnospiraceae bacterium]
MRFEDMEEAHSIELDVTTPQRKKLSIPTTIAKVQGDHILLEPIKVDNKVVGFPPSCTVNVIYAGDERAYIWKNSDVKLVKVGKNIYYSITSFLQGEPINRRGAYRVYIGEEMYLTTFTNDGPKSLTVILKDISESGFAFITKEAFDIGRAVRLSFTVGSREHELRLPATIVRRQEDENSIRVLYGCKLTDKNKLLSGILMHIQQERQKKKMNLSKQGELN